ncbi:PaaI family thioesterase [Enemella sp. A6]|uniref:PaaI family thioesterase n=1 Tax=Enemella sp. A6 TaxID=3440152 RepID=UPI003EC0CF67
MDEQDLHEKYGIMPSPRVPVAGATRSLAANLVTKQHDAETLAKAQELIEQARDLLGNNGTPLPCDTLLPEEFTAHIDYLERQMVAGRGNPFAPPSPLFELSEGRARGKANLSALYQGPPGRVHGGYVSVLLDHIVGAAVATVLTPPFFTRTLQVDFLDGVPLNTDLQLNGWVDELDGRKAWMIGTVHDGDRLLARGRALMVQPKRSKE